MTASDSNSNWNSWNQGGELFATLAKKISPLAEIGHLEPLGETLYASPELTDWKAESVCTEVILNDQAIVVAMLVQAWSDRADWASLRCDGTESRRNYFQACRIIQNVAKYLPTGEEGVA